MKPEDKFFEASNLMLPPSIDRVTTLEECATWWAAEGKLIAAGHSCFTAIRAGWGIIDDARMTALAMRGFSCFLECAKTSTPGSLDALLALHYPTRCTTDFVFSDPEHSLAIKSLLKGMRHEYANRLVEYFSDTHNATAYLVRGFYLGGPIPGPWKTSFPDYVVQEGVSIQSGADMSFTMPSAFHAFGDVGDFPSAKAIADRFPDGFDTPGLIGWRHAITGYLDSENAQHRFLDAANSFSSDTSDRPRKPGESWSSLNKDIWAPYFRSRSLLAKAIASPKEAATLIQQAAALAPPRIGWQVSKASKYHLFVKLLSDLVNGSDSASLARTKEAFTKELRLWGPDSGDIAVLEFSDLALESLSTLRTERGQGLRVLAKALSKLDQLSPAQKAEKEIGQILLTEESLKILDGLSITWIHRTLESIRDERILQRVFLRLLQNQVPQYAQIRHGPLEYGKDIAVVQSENGAITLRMFQVKAGNIGKSEWLSIKPQLEEISEVPLSALQFPGPVDQRIGILIFNGHITPHAEPNVAGWQAEQAKLGRRYEIMHLDAVVSYIINMHLIGALKSALSELNVAILGLGSS